MTWNPFWIMFNLIVDIDFRMFVRRTLFSVNVLVRDRLPVQIRVDMVKSFIAKSIDNCCNLFSLQTSNWSPFWLHCRYNHRTVCHASGSNCQQWLQLHQVSLASYRWTVSGYSQVSIVGNNPFWVFSISYILGIEYSKLLIVVGVSSRGPGIFSWNQKFGGHNKLGCLAFL